MEEADDEPLMCCEPPPVDITVEMAAILVGEKLRAAASVLGEKHAMVATSGDRGCDLPLCGVTRALNDTPGTESQSAHEISVSIAAPPNGPTGEQDEQDKDI
uniref:E3 ubiquitin-protein ligase n=2 Tax=Mesocestoides corti TaxID=53468 RepID=A0A5K3G5Z9_MESCO